MLARVLAFPSAQVADFPLRKRAYGINVVTGTETPIAEPVLPGSWVTSLAWCRYRMVSSPVSGPSPHRCPAVPDCLTPLTTRSKTGDLRYQDPPDRPDAGAPYPALARAMSVLPSLPQLCVIQGAEL